MSLIEVRLVRGTYSKVIDGKRVKLRAGDKFKATVKEIAALGKDVESAAAPVPPVKPKHGHK